jgi:hypothetical protein
MPVQPQPLYDSEPSEPIAAPPPQQAELSYSVPPPPPVGHPTPVWLQRISLFILVIFCVYLGVIVAVLPWWRSIWDYNGLFLSHPHVWAVMRLGPVRGVISGLGLLDIWIGISEAVHYRDQRP